MDKCIYCECDIDSDKKVCKDCQMEFYEISQEYE